MKLFRQLSTAIISVTIAIIPLQIVIAAESEEIAELAEKITVKVSQTDGSGNGSGVIFNRGQNTYFVVTNRHVIVDGYKYEIKTHDGQSYPLTIHQEIPGLDLIIVKFESERKYNIAQLEDLEESEEVKIKKLQTVYVAGFPGRQDSIDIIDGIIRRIDKKVLENPELNEGYALEYTNQTFPGSSGGAVLDDEGRLIGINGQSQITVGGIEIRRGIPIHFFKPYIRKIEEEIEKARNPIEYERKRQEREREEQEEQEREERERAEREREEQEEREREEREKLEEQEREKRERAEREREEREREERERQEREREEREEREREERERQKSKKLDTENIFADNSSSKSSTLF